MTEKTKLAALCAFAFGLSFATAALAGQEYDLICLSNCQQIEIEKCQAAGGGDECRLVNIDHCYYQCPLIFP